MKLYFITGNKNKLTEVQSLIPEVEQLDIDLPEIQAIDPKIIISEKLNSALQHHSGPFIVEDTSLYLDTLHGLSGPLIKWFDKTIGNEGLYTIAEKLDNFKATAKVIIGLSINKGQIEFFEGSINGEIVQPQGANGFGWDPIFKPTGYDKTFAQMHQTEKDAISMRRLALNKLKLFLETSKV